MEKQSRSILAILSTDIPGYTQKTEENEKSGWALSTEGRERSPEQWIHILESPAGRFF